MKLTKERLKRIIKEELQGIMAEKTARDGTVKLQLFRGEGMQSKSVRMIIHLRIEGMDNIQWPANDKGIECFSDCQAKFKAMDPGEMASLVLNKTNHPNKGEIFAGIESGAIRIKKG